MGRNRKKHKKKQKEKVIKYNVEETVPVVVNIDIPIVSEKVVKKSVNWSNMRVITTGRKRGPIYV